MSATTIGEGIVPLDIMPKLDAPEPGPVEMPSHETPGAGLDIERIKAEVRAELRGEMAAVINDVERRLGQARELERSALYGEGRAVHAEDLNVAKHFVDGYTLTANSPAGGSIAWVGLHVVYLGVDYTIADGNTALKYTWFVKPGSGTTATLQSSNTMPTLGANDAMIFINNAGTPVSVLESSISYAVGPNVIGNSQLQDGAVSSAKTDFYTSLAAAVTAAQNTADLAKSTADGAINTYFQSAQPWAPAATHTPDRVGDIWYDSDDGQAYRWTGNGGTWMAIEDSNIGAALAAANAAQAKADIKTTTYYSALASPPTAPTPPAGSGFTVGDFWVVTDQGNLIKRWSGSAWVDLQMGNAAISAVDGGKITTGTVAAARVGSGVNGAVLTTATGTVGSTQIATNAITPPKINAAFHMLY